MSQMPRWYREQELIHRSGLDSLNSGLIDQQTVQNTRQAIKEILDEQDIAYAKRQVRSVSDIKDSLRNPLSNLGKRRGML